MKATMRIIKAVIEALVIVVCFVMFLYYSIDLLTEWDWLNDLLNSADDILTIYGIFGNVAIGLGGVIGFSVASIMSSSIIALSLYLGWHIGGWLKVMSWNIRQMALNRNNSKT